MTDKEYIIGFKNNDEAVITTFYRCMRSSFVSYFRSHYSKDDSYILDLFQDSCIVLWNNISHGKLSEDSLHCSLSTYFLSIGRYTMMAKDRKYKEIVDDDALSRICLIDDDAETLKEKIEKEDFVYRVVSEMKPPCSLLLKAHYWDKLSGIEIARKYGYSGPDSVKSQKLKCIKKLRPLIEAFMKL